MNVGFIGTGNMGTILIESFIKAAALHPDQMIVTNRTFAKAEKLASAYPGLRAFQSNVAAAREADILFLCIKPQQYKQVIDEIKAVMRPEQIVISITSPVLVRHLEDHFPSKVAKIIPSITNFVNSGAILTIYGDRLNQADREGLDRLFRHISQPLPISEEHTRICSDLSSCGPAFLTFFIQQFVNSAVEHSGIPRETAIRLVSEMMLGTAQLLTSGAFTMDALLRKVTVVGGVTADGLAILSTDTDGSFERLIHATHHKYYEDLKKVEELLYNPSQ